MSIGYTASIANELARVNRRGSIKTDMNDLGTTVRDLRQARGWTQQELADRLGVSQRWVSDVENGRTTMPRLARLRRLADTLGVDRGVLIAAADYASRRELADAIGGEPSDDDRLREAHRRLDPYLRRLTPAQLAHLERTAELFTAVSGNNGDEGPSESAPESPDGPDDERPE